MLVALGRRELTEGAWRSSTTMSIRAPPPAEIGPRHRRIAAQRDGPERSVSWQKEFALPMSRFAMEFPDRPLVSLPRTASLRSRWNSAGARSAPSSNWRGDGDGCTEDRQRGRSGRRRAEESPHPRAGSRQSETRRSKRKRLDYLGPGFEGKELRSSTPRNGRKDPGRALRRALTAGSLQRKVRPDTRLGAWPGAPVGPEGIEVHLVSLEPFCDVTTARFSRAARSTVLTCLQTADGLGSFPSVSHLQQTDSP